MSFEPNLSQGVKKTLYIVRISDDENGETIGKILFDSIPSVPKAGERIRLGALYSSEDQNDELSELYTVTSVDHSYTVIYPSDENEPPDTGNIINIFVDTDDIE